MVACGRIIAPREAGEIFVKPYNVTDLGLQVSWQVFRSSHSGAGDWPKKYIVAVGTDRKIIVVGTYFAIKHGLRGFAR